MGDVTHTDDDRKVGDGTLSSEAWRNLKAEWTHDEGLRRLEDRGVRYEDEAEQSLDRDPLRQATGIRVRPGEDNPLGFRDDRSFDIHDATGKIGHLTGYLGGPWSDAERDTEFRVTHVEISEPGARSRPANGSKCCTACASNFPRRRSWSAAIVAARAAGWTLRARSCSGCPKGRAGNSRRPLRRRRRIWRSRSPPPPTWSSAGPPSPRSSQGHSPRRKP